MSDRRNKRRYSSDSDDDDFIRWKISKLKKRLAAKDRSRDKRSVSSSPSIRSKSTFDQPDVNLQRDSFISPECSDDDDIPLSAFITAGDAGTSSGPISTLPEEGTLTLDANILALWGDEQPSPEPVGPKMHKDLASRWSSVLSNGLSEESVNCLLKKYPAAENCALLKGPRVNPEVAAVINEQVARRDANLLSLQNQIGAALSALGQLATALVSEEGGAKHSYIELTSDASRLLMDFHHKYSVIRRDLLILNLRKDLKDTLTNVSADGWIFGKDLSERIKASRDIEKAGLDLKPTKTAKPTIRTNNTFKQHYQQLPGNSYRPPRRTSKAASRGGQHKRASQSSQQRPYSAQRKATDQDRRHRQGDRPIHRRNL